MGLGGVFRAIGRASNWAENQAAATRRKLRYGNDVDTRYIPAQADQLLRALMIEQEKRDLQRQEIEARIADRRAADEDRDTNRRLGVEARARDYARGAALLDPETGTYSRDPKYRLPEDVTATLGSGADSIIDREIAALNNAMTEKRYMAQQAAAAEGAKNSRELEERLAQEARAFAREKELRKFSEDLAAGRERKPKPSPTIDDLYQDVAREDSAAVRSGAKVAPATPKQLAEEAQRRLAGLRAAQHPNDPLWSLDEPTAPPAPPAAPGGKGAPIVQVNDKTGEVRHSLDGGKTWIAGPPR